MTKRRFVVIGGDAAGMSAASLARRRDPDLEIEAYEMGSYTSYGACGMPYYVSGEVPELDDLVVVTPGEFEQERGIKVFLRHRVERIIPQENLIEALNLETGQVRRAPYDELLIATGAEPIVPPDLDTSLPGVFTLRGLADAGSLKAWIKKHERREAVVVGTGYIGLEMAEALTLAGLKVTLIGRRPRVMPTFEEEISAAAAEELTRHEVQVRTGAEAGRAEIRSDGRLALSLTDGETLTADLILVGAGVNPRSRLAQEAGLDLGEKKAIKVDQSQKTSHPHIWAAGDCAEAYHLLRQNNAYVPLALTANRQGRVVGFNVTGGSARFPGILGSAVCKVFDLAVARTGLGLKEAQSQGLDAVKVMVTSRSRPHYYPGSAPVRTVLIVERKTNKLWGAQMAGTDGVAPRINTWAAALAAGFSLEQVYNLDLAYAPPFSPVWDPVLISAEVAMKQIKG
ncbi:MAG: FAD-dependent oxidoreductase [Thermodesulfobacteriota bacterium]